MDEIIKEIINIDKEASRKLEEAERMKDDVIKNQITAENKELRHKMRERAQMHLNRVREIEQAHADQKIASINAQRDSELAAIKKVFDEKHQAWEDDLYNHVLGR